MFIVHDENNNVQYIEHTILLCSLVQTNDKRYVFLDNTKIVCICIPENLNTNIYTSFLTIKTFVNSQNTPKYSKGYFALKKYISNT